jgi:glycosyltransferase involved in cell wall biosynthesis
MKILFIPSATSSFMRTDFDILSEVHDVRSFDFPGPSGGWFKIIRRLPLLWRNVKWADLTFSWFGKLHAFFAVLFSKILKKKSVVVISGGEVCRFSFLVSGKNYRGICTQPIKRWFPRYVARWADLLLPVSQYVYQEALESVGADPRRMKMIYHGFDTDIFKPKYNVMKDSSVVTIGEVMEENLYNKRFLEFVESAEFLPGNPFILIGPNRDGVVKGLKNITAPNLVFTGGVYGKDLINFLNKASVYVQASICESFGCALAEAMACECVPVVSRIPALEEVVGDCGVYLNNPVTPQEIAKKVKIALRRPELGKCARERIIEKFPLEKRCRALLDAIDGLMPEGAVQR